MFAKSSYSNGGSACVEVGNETDGNAYDVLVRDTKDDGHGPVLHYTPAEWLAFIKGVKDGQFDLSPELTAAAEAELATT